MLSQPGVTRDGTLFARNTYSEFQWMRLYQNRPRKILGYRQQMRNVDGIVRAFSTESFNNETYVHSGTQNLLLRYTVSNVTGLASTGIISRTPALFDGDDNNGWQFSMMYDTSSDINLLFASAVPNMADISDSTEMPIYYGHVEGEDALVAIADANAVASGGVVALLNYLVIYGNDGVVKWSVPGEPLDFTTTADGAGDARPVANKIVRGLPIRGQGGAAGIFWSLDSVFLMQFVGGDPIFTFDTLTNSSSILSSNGIIEHNGIFYWATTNGFSFFNGVIRDLPNDFNKLWFLENLNWAQRQKVFAVKIPRYDEIWWCFPYGDATECSHAVIYNIKSNVWYDTVLPADKRTAGQYAQIFEYPIMSCGGNPETATSNVWQHEYGLDAVLITGSSIVSLAIPAWFTTHELNVIDPSQGGGRATKSRSLSYSYIEPDFDQEGDLTIEMISRYNVRDTETDTRTLTVPEIVAANAQLPRFKNTGRLSRFKVMTNEVGGNLITGNPLIHIAPGDDRKQR